MTKETIENLIAKTQENKTKLESCRGPHDFQPIQETRKYRCTKCDGEINITNYYWYYKGLTHARQMPKTEDEELEQIIKSVRQL